MNGDQMPSDFGVRYVFWVTWHWIYFNPLTILLIAQAVLFQLALDNPAIHWLGTGASVMGVIVAQIRNRNKDYTVSILPSKAPVIQPDLPPGD